MLIIDCILNYFFSKTSANKIKAMSYFFEKKINKFTGSHEKSYA